MKHFLTLIVLAACSVACTDKSVLTHTITIDHNLSDNQIEMAEAAIEEWRVATGCYTLAGTMRSHNDQADSFCPKTEIGPVTLWQPYAIKKVKSIEGSSGTAAMAHWYDSWIIVDRDYSGAVFKQAVKHEIAHYLDLHFDQHKKYSDPVTPIVDAIHPSNDMHTTTNACDLMTAVFDLEDCAGQLDPPISNEHIEAFKARWVD